jgi:hypothetical protein
MTSEGVGFSNRRNACVRSRYVMGTGSPAFVGDNAKCLIQAE